MTISIDKTLLRRLDQLVKSRAFKSRSQLIEEALKKAISRIDRTRLARECSKLVPAEEQRFADDVISED